MLWQSRCIGCGECLGRCPQGAIAAVQKTDGSIGYITDRTLCTCCGECFEACAAGARELVGRLISVDDTVREIERDRLFYEESGGGVTFSGGEPLAQAAFLDNLLRSCKHLDIHTAVDTSGYAAWHVLDRIRANTDLFLYDLKIIEDIRHRKYTGVSNQRILENLRALLAHNQRVILRVPIIPGINDDAQNLRCLGEFAASLTGLERVDILPYHPSARGKYERLAQPYSLSNICSPSDMRMQEIAQMLEHYHPNIRIGG